MSTNYHAYAIIGLRVPKDKIIGTVTKHRNRCKCEPQTDPMSEQKFCGKCGEILDLAYRADDLKFGMNGWDLCKKGIKGWLVASDGDYEGYFYIGIRKAVDRDEKPVGVRDTRTMDQQENKFKSDMIELGLWDPDEYGLWAVLQASW